MAKNVAFRIAPYISWLTAYAVIVGTLYLWGFWSKFHLNILEYIGLLDLAKAAAFPLFSSIIGSVGGVLLSHFFVNKALPPGGGVETPAGRVLNRHKNLLLVTYLAIVLVGFSLIGSPDVRAFLMPLALSPLVVFAVIQYGFLSDVISEPATRGTAIAILTLILCSAFGYGRLHAADIVDGNEYFSINIETLPNLPTQYRGQSGDFKYLGRASDYLFVLTPDSSLLVIRAGEASVVMLRYRTTKHLWPPWVRA